MGSDSDQRADSSRSDGRVIHRELTKVEGSRRRSHEKGQAEYIEYFLGAVPAFHPNHADLAEGLARAVTNHVKPVGSGTIARTDLIPVDQRADAAVIAWMLKTTTGYDGMVILRVKTSHKRRAVEWTTPDDLTFSEMPC